jgi:hypothetical protein
MFTELKTLVIDRNHITDAMVFPALPGLQNLWANDNQVYGRAIARALVP